MTVKKFLAKNITAANVLQRKYGIPAVVTLAMAALESGYAKKTVMYNYFGYTASKSYPGDKVLMTTTEYHTTPNVKYEKILDIKQIAPSRYKYRVKRYFRAYKSPEDSFMDYGSLIYNADRYNAAFNYTHDPVKFFNEVYKGGYATDPDYYKLVVSIMKSMSKYIVS